jgi:hypothetical protein
VCLLLRVVCSGVLFCCLAAAESAQDAAHAAEALRHLALDPAETYRVRDLQLARGDLRLYLTDGVLSFAKPISGRRLAAVFTTSPSDTGDAEIIVMPPQRSERASLASYTKSPNLDEHFTFAVLFFSDDTDKEILGHINQQPVRKGSDLASDLSKIADPLLQESSSEIQIRLVETLLDNHPPDKGFLYASVLSRELGSFTTLYEPREAESFSIGRFPGRAAERSNFELWTSFRPRRAAPPSFPPSKISDYHLETDIRDDLSLSAIATFKATAADSDGRVLSFGLSDHLRVRFAKIDGRPVEVFQVDSPRVSELKRGGSFLLIADAPLQGGTTHQITVAYEGSVIRKTEEGTYFVDERNAWYPFLTSMNTVFDFTFRCPEKLRLVSSGELVSENVANGTRVVHRKTMAPVRLVGFNLGDYDVASEEHGRYRVECYANKEGLAPLSPSHPDQISQALADVSKETKSILDSYTSRWSELPIRSVAVSPITGYFGQGFPGLIYLSTVSYTRQEERPTKLRSARMDTFFTDMLLPHEIAHQWWGNVVTQADYRGAWISEAMANYSALQYLEGLKGRAVRDAVLAEYRDDLARFQRGRTVESAGPVDFGYRLLNASGFVAWRTILYEKGTWILHMLHQRLGNEGFLRLQQQMLRDYSDRPLSTEDFRKMAAGFVPNGQPDHSLVSFFDTWVYGTGVPRLKLTAGRTPSVETSDVDDDFTADLPLTCGSARAKRTTWLRISKDSTPVPSSATCELPSPSEYLFYDSR